MGIAASRVTERVLAASGQQLYAPSIFEANASVLKAGVLLSLPALISQGLNKFFSTYSPLPPGFYGHHHIVLLMCFMAFCRIKNPEQLKKHPPGELGKLLGLDRIPEVGYFRRKLKQLIKQNKNDELHNSLMKEWITKMPEMFYYIDGHVRVYHGRKANLPKHFVSREKLCLNGTTEFWVNDQWGQPLMVITAELNERLKDAIELAIERILPQVPTPTTQNADPPVFTLIFDREAYEPAWFKKLWTKHKVAIISYRKNVKDQWDENLFHKAETQLLNNNVTMQLCEMGVRLSGLWFREVRKLSDNGHQTSILTTHPTLSLEHIAAKMFSRWTQENFFKYMNENFDFDKMIEYGSEMIDQKRIIPNPIYRKLSYKLKKTREKKARLEAKVYKKIQENPHETIEQVKTNILKTSTWIEQINDYQEQIAQLLKERETVPSRISLSEMPEEQRYNKLKQESKKFKNAVLMLAYRAETALYNTLTNFYKYTEKEGRMLLKEIFSSDADIIPDYNNKTLTITLHSLSTPRANQAVKKLCDFLNATQTTYPYSDLQLIYKTLAV